MEGKVAEEGTIREKVGRKIQEREPWMRKSGRNRAGDQAMGWKVRRERIWQRAMGKKVG